MEFIKKLEILNRRATFEYHFVYTVQAGIILTGTEVKSLRTGQANLSDAYCVVKNGELLLEKMHISEYKLGTYNNHEAKRSRKLLVKKHELKKLHNKVKEQGYTIVPYRVYVSDRGLIKIEIALAKGKKNFDKRDSLQAKDLKRETDRALKYLD